MQRREGKSPPAARVDDAPAGSEQSHANQLAMFRQLFYISRASASVTEPAVRRILHISRRNNRQRDITGCLLYSGRHFAQIIEGGHDALDELMARLGKDQRHEGLVVLIDRRVERRRFPEWSMGMLYKLDTADRIDELLAAPEPSEQDALALFHHVNPDSVMGAL